MEGGWEQDGKESLWVVVVGAFSEDGKGGTGAGGGGGCGGVERGCEAYGRLGVYLSGWMEGYAGFDGGVARSYIADSQCATQRCTA